MTRTDLLHTIAEHLPEFSATQDEHDRWFLTRPDGATIILTGNAYSWNYSKRIEISGSYPKHNSYYFGPRKSDAPSITCARSRGPEAIAKDITRRFLPKYLPLYETSTEHYENYLASEMLRDATLTQLSAILHCEPYRSGAEPRLYYYSDHGNATIKASADTVNMDIRNLSITKAIEIAKVLAS